MNRRMFLMIKLVLAIVLFVACVGVVAPVEAAGEQVVRTFLVEEPKTLDPGLSSDSVGGYVITDTMDSLTRLEADGQGGYAFAPAGAATWESNEDGTVWTFYLNENTWSDGVPVTAGDYEYGIKRVANPDTGAPLVDMLFPLLNYDAVVRGDLSPDELGVKALDDSTLEITLTQPMPFFLSLTDSRVYAPQRADILEAYGEKFGTEAEYTISNGPFKVESWVHNSAITLVKNEHYWDADSVKLDKVIYSIITDTTTRLNAFESGELDNISVSNIEWRDKFMAIDGVQYFAVPTATLTYSFFNTTDPVFQNANIRKAFMIGIDREELNEMCFGSLRVPTYGWVVPSITVEETNFREAAGDPVKEIAEAAGDPKELLIKGMEELGLGSDPSTLDVTFSLAGTDDWFQTLGAYLQQAYLTTLGINLKLDFSEWGIFYSNVQNGDYQIGFMGWGAFYNEPYDVMSLLMTTSNAIMTNWSNAEYDALLEEARVEMDAARRLELYIEAERILLDDAAANPLACSTNNVFYNSRVKGITPSTFGSEGFKYVFIEE